MDHFSHFSSSHILGSFTRGIESIRQLYLFFLYYFNMTYSWDLVRNRVRDFRTALQMTYPIQVLATVKDFVIDGDALYFLSNHRITPNICPSRHLKLYTVRLEQCTGKIKRASNNYCISVLKYNRVLTKSRQGRVYGHHELPSFAQLEASILRLFQHWKQQQRAVTYSRNDHF